MLAGDVVTAVTNISGQRPLLLPSIALPLRFFCASDAFSLPLPLPLPVSP
jgi:hypothetical protein